MILSLNHRYYTKIFVNTSQISIGRRGSEAQLKCLMESFGFVPIYTLLGSDMVLFICLRFHAFSSIQHCKRTPPYIIHDILLSIYPFCQIILVPSLVLVLLAEVSRLISMRSYVKIVAADTSYSLTRASLDRR